jgi:hypothetical protein
MSISQQADTAVGADVHITRNVMVSVRDGIRLATDIYRPMRDGMPVVERLPVLLERTPYDKSGVSHRDFSLANPVPVSKAEIAAAFTRQGYVVAIQDCRGRYNSEGVFTKYLSEAADGFDTLAWLRQQEWCDGKIGTFGLSYSAHTQLALACLAPEGLAAMFLESGGFSSAFHNGVRQGGAFELKQAVWSYMQAQHSAKADRNAARGKSFLTEDLGDWFMRMPWTRGASPLSAAPEYEDYLFEQWENGEFSPFWESLGIYARGYYDILSDVPMVHMTGWYDPYARTATENYIALSSIKRGPVKLVLGPWTHGQRSVSHSGNVEFGPAAPLDGNLAPDYIALRLAWFDKYLKGKAAPDYLPKPVRLFVMGGGSGAKNAEGRLVHGGQWRDEDNWPLSNASQTDFFLTTAGQLTPEKPSVDHAHLEYVFDPRNPVPTIGGAITSGEPLMKAGAYDQRENPTIFGAKAPYRALSERADVLVFQTEPLAADTEVTGPIAATLFVSATTPDTDITVKLIDVYPTSPDWPEGFAMNLSHGILRLRYRDSFTDPRMMKPGVVYEVQIEAFPTANLFVKGHRIRLDISSSNFPHFDVNPNSGEPESKAAAKVTAHIKIHMDRKHPSRLVLPVVRRP